METHKRTESKVSNFTFARYVQFHRQQQATTNNTNNTDMEWKRLMIRFCCILSTFGNMVCVCATDTSTSAPAKEIQMNKVHAI